MGFWQAFKLVKEQGW